MSDIDEPVKDTSAFFGAEETKLDTPTMSVSQGPDGVNISAATGQAMRETTLGEDLFHPFGPEQVPVTTDKE